MAGARTDTGRRAERIVATGRRGVTCGTAILVCALALVTVWFLASSRASRKEAEACWATIESLRREINSVRLLVTLDGPRGNHDPETFNREYVTVDDLLAREAREIN